MHPDFVMHLYAFDNLVCELVANVFIFWSFKIYGFPQSTTLESYDPKFEINFEKLLFNVYCFRVFLSFPVGLTKKLGMPKFFDNLRESFPSLDNLKIPYFFFYIKVSVWMCRILDISINAYDFYEIFEDNSHTILHSVSLMYVFHYLE